MLQLSLKSLDGWTLYLKAALTGEGTPFVLSSSMLTDSMQEENPGGST